MNELGIAIMFLALIISGAAIVIVQTKVKCPEPVCPQPNISLDCPQAELSCPAAPDCNCAEIPDCTCNPVNTWVVKKSYSSHLFEVASSAATELDYTTDERWDSDDMAQETADRLQHAGYDCDRVCGWYYEYIWVEHSDGTLTEELSDKTRHCWTECDNVIIESTVAENTIVPAENYRQYKR